MNKTYLLLLFFCLFKVCIISPITIDVSTKLITNQTYQIIVSIQLKPGDYIYKDLISFSVDNAHATISKIKTNNQEETIFDTLFKKTKQIYKNKVCFQIEAHIEHILPPIPDIYLHVTVYNRAQHTFITRSFKIVDSHPTAHQTIASANNTSAIFATDRLTQPLLCGSKKNTPLSWTQKLSSILEHTSSLWAQAGLALLLGALMSLTPCIYPMIPITAGIMQTHAAHSLLITFGLSSAYTLGIATTFASFGLIAAHTGQLFNRLFQNPFIIILFIIVLLYLAGSMLELYTLYIPSFFTLAEKKRTLSKSFFSAFCFGALSGTIASPCLSPGLVLLLSIVLSIGNKVIGFVLLFAFGIGISVPLLIIGSCSGALHLLPRAGLWMNEIKKLFGLLLLASSLYLLRSLVSISILLTIATLGCFVIGICYWIKATRTHHNQILLSFFAFCFTALSVPIAFKTYQAYFPQEKLCVSLNSWETNYYCALEKAKTENKKLLIDIGASNCSLCTAIDERIFGNQIFLKTLTEHCILLKINSDDEIDNQCTILQEQFTLLGVPTILLLNPYTQVELVRWGGELYTMPVEQFIEQIKEH